MSEIKIIEGKSKVRDTRVAIVAARFNNLIVDGLLRGALEALRDAGLHNNDIHQVHVPGAFEIPLTVKRLAASGDYDAIIALGAVIRGDTAHFKFVAGECAGGLMQAMLNTGVPVSFGVLTAETTEQALLRSADDGSNKGREAALAAIEMLTLLRELP
ncbi:MAG: 6,7-dimethyl-8-ribityllumazine synthase [Gammaproteobacteria bacterium]